MRASLRGSMRLGDDDATWRPTQQFAALQMPNFDEADLEPIAYILMGARDALTFRYLSHEASTADLAIVVNTYQRMLSFGLFKPA